MESKNLEIKAAIQVLKPVSEVYEAIVNPVQMSNYFINDSTGRMEEGANLIWHFPEIKDIDVPVEVRKMVKDKYVSYRWDIGDIKTLIEMNLEPYEGNATVITITEKGMENNEAGIKWLKGNTEGWANFLACLKAWLEYGIHLRKGAFDFRFKK